MPRFRQTKVQLREWLQHETWQELAASLDALPPEAVINPLLACLPLGEPVTSRAAALLGRHVNRLMNTSEGEETARTFMRRLMWHMNEESGNIGWGIPEAFGAILAANRKLAETYGRVLISYVLDTGHNDNFCDHAPLRRSCYRAVRTLIEAWPDLPEVASLGGLAYRALRLGMEHDPDETCRQLAAETFGALKQAQSRLA